MPKSLNINKYPRGMLDLLESICDTQHPATIIYKDAKAASAGRFDFYGLIKALQAAEHSLSVPLSYLKFTTHGTTENPKEKRMLKIFFPEHTIDGNFYEVIAKEHAKDADKVTDPLHPTPLTQGANNESTKP